MAELWDPSDVGVLRLPSGRVIRGHGLRQALPLGRVPTFAVYLLGKVTARPTMGESVVALA